MGYLTLYQRDAGNEAFQLQAVVMPTDLTNEAPQRYLDVLQVIFGRGKLGLAGRWGRAGGHRAVTNNVLQFGRSLPDH